MKEVKKCHNLVGLKNVNSSRGFVTSLLYSTPYTYGCKLWSYNFFVCSTFDDIFINKRIKLITRDLIRTNSN